MSDIPKEIIDQIQIRHSDTDLHSLKGQEAALLLEIEKLKKSLAQVRLKINSHPDSAPDAKQRAEEEKKKAEAAKVERRRKAQEQRDAEFEKVKQQFKEFEEILRKQHQEDLRRAEEAKKSQEQQKANEEYRRRAEEEKKRAEANKLKPDEILRKYGIYSKKDYKVWILANHTDKGGKLEDVQIVNAAATAMEWI